MKKTAFEMGFEKRAGIVSAVGKQLARAEAPSATAAFATKAEGMLQKSRGTVTNVGETVKKEVDLGNYWGPKMKQTPKFHS